MLVQTITAFAGLGLFLAGLNLISEVARSLAARRVRLALARLVKLPFSYAMTGTLLGAVTQSTSASAYICIGLLQSRAVSFPVALTISAWSGVGTAALVFLASIDLRLAALFALSLVAFLYLSALYQHSTGRRMTELLLAFGVILLGLAFVKDAGHVLEQNPWAQEFIVFSSESWIYGFLIGFVITLVMHSSSTVSILAVAMSATGLLPVNNAIVLICGANLGSGLSIALVSSHLTGLPRQVSVAQAVGKSLGTLAVLPAALAMMATGLMDHPAIASLPVPTVIAITYLLLNLAAALLSGLFRASTLRFLNWVAPLDREREQFEPEFILEEAVDDPEIALILARQEQARLIGLLPDALSPLRPDDADAPSLLENGLRRDLSSKLVHDIESFISQAVDRHPQNADFSGLLQLQRCNNHTLPLIEALHDYVNELTALAEPLPHETSMCDSMTETLHLLLGLLGEQVKGEPAEAEMLRNLTGDRSGVMTRFRNEIVMNSTKSNANREALFVATGLFERLVWLIRQLSGDLGALDIVAPKLPA